MNKGNFFHQHWERSHNALKGGDVRRRLGFTFERFLSTIKKEKRKT